MSDSHDLLEAARRLIAQEAYCLDERRWDEWLDMYTPDCEFWMPTWVSEEQLADDPQSQLSQIYYANRSGLEDRIARIRTGKSPASTPMRRTTHMHSNLMLLDSEPATSMTLRTAWTCHVHDPSSKKSFVLFGHARYTLSQQQDRWLIAKKKVVVQNDYLPSMLDVYCI